MPQDRETDFLRFINLPVTYSKVNGPAGVEQSFAHLLVPVLFDGTTKFYSTEETCLATQIEENCYSFLFVVGKGLTSPITPFVVKINSQDNNIYMQLLYIDLFESIESLQTWDEEPTSPSRVDLRHYSYRISSSQFPTN